MAAMVAASLTSENRIFKLLQLPVSALFTDVHGAYATFVQEYTAEREEAKKLRPAERKVHKYKRSGVLFKEVSTAFLSYLQTHVHQDKTSRSLREPEHFSVIHNTSSLTVHIPEESVKSWKIVCEAYYGVKGTDRGINGVQYSTTFLDTDIQLGKELGSIHITVYETNKLLVQGTSYLLWLVSHYSILQGMVLSDIAERRYVDPHDRNLATDKMAITSPQETITVCAVCNKQEVQGDEFVGCSNCPGWTHFACTGLDDATIALLRDTDEKYHCINCQIPRDVTLSANLQADIDVSGPPVNSRSTGVCNNAKVDNRSYANGNSETKVAPDCSFETKEKPKMAVFYEKFGCLQKALIDLESSLASTKIQANKFESGIAEQLSVMSKKLDSVRCSCIHNNDNIELRNLREENGKLRNRVKHLEDVVASLKTTSLVMKSEMTDIKLSQDLLKVKVGNVKDLLKSTKNDTTQRQSNSEESVLSYALPTANRFEVLSLEESTTEKPAEEDADGSVSQSTQDLDSTNINEVPYQESVARKTVVLIGDSNAQRLKPNLLCPSADTSMPYWCPNLFTAPTVLGDISGKDTPPHTVILHLGTNDIMSKSKETVISEYEVTVSATQSLFPNADVVISAIPPRRETKCRPNVNEDISAVNMHLQNMCETNDQLLYVSHPQLWKDNDYKPFVYEKDGYHLNSDGVRIIAYNLKKQASKALGLSPVIRHVKSPRRSRNANKNDAGNSFNSMQYKRSKPGNNRFGQRISTRTDQSRGYPRHMRPFNSAPRSSNTYKSLPMAPRRSSPGRQKPTRGPQRETVAQGMPGPTYRYGGFASPVMPAPVPAPVPAPAPGSVFFPASNRQTPLTQWLQEWPSPAEAYSAPQNNIDRPRWFGPPPYPLLNTGRSWYGRSCDSSLGLNEGPRIYGSV